jgi:hypothetical protein
VASVTFFRNLDALRELANIQQEAVEVAVPAAKRGFRFEGMLMANSLHFLSEPSLLLTRLLSLADVLLVVEYERSRANRWVSYPVPLNRLHQLLASVGVDGVETVANKSSLFGGTLYSAVARLSKP